jgi:cold shock protein
MPSRTVKWCNPTKVTVTSSPGGGGTYVLVHISAVEKAGFTSLAEAARVTDDIAEPRQGERGKPAGHVRPSLGCF